MLDAEPVFATSRLQCRRWRPTDLQRLVEVYADPVAARWVDDGAPITREEAESWLDVTNRNYATRGYGMFALERGGEVIGFLGLVHPNQQEAVEVKYSFLRSCWGQGYASEAVAGALKYAEAVHGIEHIVATVAPENLASQRVLLKCGFKHAHRQDDTTEVFSWRSAKHDGSHSG